MLCVVYIYFIIKTKVILLVCEFFNYFWNSILFFLMSISDFVSNSMYLTFLNDCLDSRALSNGSDIVWYSNVGGGHNI